MKNKSKPRYSWEEIRQEVIEKLTEDVGEKTAEAIAIYIEKAYKLGFAKGIKALTEQLRWLGIQADNARDQIKKDLKNLN